MNTTFSKYWRFAAGLAVFALISFQTATLSAARYEEDVSSGDYLYLKGMVHSVSLTDNSLKVEQRNGPRITIRIDPETEFEGVGKLGELQARQVIKVWYRPEQDGNTGLKILRLPDLGC